MNSRERVLTTLNHKEPDRVPLNIWMFREDMQQKVIDRYGSLDNFFETLNIDMFMAITPPPNKYNPEFKEELMNMSIDEITPGSFPDPDDESLYSGVKELVKKHGGRKAILAHVWGVLEGVYSFMGVEKTLVELGLRSKSILNLFDLVRDWSVKVAQNVVELGIDILHITADAGTNERCLLSPKDWWDLLYINDREIITVGKKKGIPISMHSCGNINEILDGIVKMGVDMIHPLQTSAGMDLLKIKEKYGDKLTIHGGLDIRYLLPRAPEKEIVSRIIYYMKNLKAGGGFIFNTEHTVQPDTTLDRVELAYKTALEYGRYL